MAEPQVPRVPLATLVLGTSEMSEVSVGVTLHTAYGKFSLQVEGAYSKIFYDKNIANMAVFHVSFTIHEYKRYTFI